MLMGSYYLIITKIKKRNNLIMELGCVLRLITLGAVTNFNSGGLHLLSTQCGKMHLYLIRSNTAA